MKTGYPLDQSISVTIFAKDALTADGYDNAVMAMSVEQALAFVDAKTWKLILSITAKMGRYRHADCRI
ncbi:hypothetical protein CS542_05865 [Pedobacter sp. IW39]|nr:hypothetical protein CS542_05865 [Pedobacter sp. IW39]